MKRRSLKTTFILVTAGFFLSGIFSSCLKEEYLKDANGEYVLDSLNHKIPNDSTIIYITQEIPDINKFMPDTLLKYMNILEALHFGTEPPKIDGQFLADSLFTQKMVLMPDRPGEEYHNFHEGDLRQGKYNFEFKNQLWSVLNCNYFQFRPQPFNYYELSTDDSTYHILKDNFDKFKEFSPTPNYFKDGNFNTDEFKNTYVIGSSPYFTMYFYQVVRNEIPVSIRIDHPDFHPIIANIISGKLNKKPDGTDYISNFVWGRQCIGYVYTGEVLEKAIRYGSQFFYGDVWICNNSGKPVSHYDNEPTDNE